MIITVLAGIGSIVQCTLMLFVGQNRPVLVEAELADLGRAVSLLDDNVILGKCTGISLTLNGVFTICGSGIVRGAL